MTVRVGDLHKGSAGNVPNMPNVPTPARDERTAGLLSEAFGGDWTRWESGPAGIPGGVMWTQVGANADDRMVLTGLVVVGPGLTAESLRRIPVSVIEQAMAEKAAGSERQMNDELGKLRPLERGSLSAPEFSQVVADHYRVWARYVATPAAGMSERWGVKSATMHGWIREARLRGLLPEVGRGKRARG